MKETGSAPLRLIQVGMGGWGRDWHRRVLTQTRNVNVVGFVEPLPAALEAFRRESGVEGSICHHSLPDALGQAGAEAVLVTASLPGHAYSIRSALEAGLHVLTEKPFVATIDEGRELVALAKKQKRVLMVSQNYRFFPAPRKVQEIVRSQRLGRLGVIHVDFRKNHVAYHKSRLAHFGLPDPLLVDMAIHHFDLMRMLADSDALRIRCRSFNPPWSHYTHHAAADAAVEMKNGVVVNYRGSWVSPGPSTGWAGTWGLEFEKGFLRFDSRLDETGEGDSLESLRGSGPAKPVRLPATKKADRHGSLAAFVHAVRTGEQPETTGADNLGSLALTYGSVAAAASGGWEDITI